MADEQSSTLPLAAAHDNHQPTAAAAVRCESPFARLAAIELQLVMQHCDKWTLITLARCSRFTLAAASHPFAWRSLSPLQLLCHQPSALAGQVNSSLLRFADLAVDWQLQLDAEMTAEEVATLMSLHRLRTLTVVESQWTMRDCGVAILADALTAHSHSGCRLDTLCMDSQQIDFAGAAALAAFIARSRTLTALDLGFNQFDTDAWTPLCEALQHSESLRVLNLSRSEIHADSVDALARVLVHSGSLAELELVCCGLDSAMMAALAPGVRASGSLQRLVLSENKFGDKGALSLAAAVAHSRSLTELHLFQCKIGDAGMEALAAAAQRCPTLRGLHLRTNQLGPGCATALGRMLSAEDCALTQLDLTDNFKVGDEVLESLAAALRLNRSLSDLKFNSCNVSAKGAEALARALQRSGARSGLHTLVLFINIPIEGAAPLAALADAMRSGLALRHLQVGSNAPLTDAEFAALAAGLPHCPTLRHLGLQGCRFGETGAVALAGGISAHQNLTELNVRSNSIGDAGLAVLAPALQSCRSLCSLDLGHCGLAALAASALAPLLQSSRSLMTLRLDGNSLGGGGAVALANALHSESSLRFLHVDQCGLHAADTAALARAIGRGWSPLLLDLSQCDMDAQSAESLAAALSQRSRSLPLQMLWMTTCRLQAAQLELLIRAALLIPALRSLYVNDNLRFADKSNKAAHALRAVCSVRPNIHMLI